MSSCSSRLGQLPEINHDIWRVVFEAPLGSDDCPSGAAWFSVSFHRGGADSGRRLRQLRGITDGADPPFPRPRPAQRQLRRLRISPSVRFTCWCDSATPAGRLASTTRPLRLNRTGDGLGSISILPAIALVPAWLDQFHLRRAAPALAPRPASVEKGNRASACPGAGPLAEVPTRHGESVRHDAASSRRSLRCCTSTSMSRTHSQPAQARTMVNLVFSSRSTTPHAASNENSWRIQAQLP